MSWLAFIPFGILFGSIFSIPIVFCFNIWNQDNAFFASVIKNGFNVYFMILCMAWIVPSTFSKSNFKAVVSMLFGFVITLTLMALVGPTDGDDNLRWEAAGEIVGATLGFLAGTQWDQKGLQLLLENVKGVHPYNAMTPPKDA